MAIVSSLLTFPSISWWAQTAHATTVILDAGEHFQKMSYRNRYRISGANNSNLLSIPLVNGRNQHLPMRDMQIFNEERWQVKHWRTLVSVYKRSPYFDHYEERLRTLFETQFTHLADFNHAGILWVKQQLKLPFELTITNDYIKEYPPGTTDLRNIKNTHTPLPKYHQVFEDRLGFLPDLSILDLLFSEGPGARGMLLG